LLYGLLWALFLSGHLVPGLLIQALLDDLTGASAAGLGFWSLLAAMVGVQTARLTANFVKRYGEETFRYRSQMLLRGNIIRNRLRRPGAERLPVPIGDAISRLRGDVAELADFPTCLSHVLGHAAFAVMAMGVMVSTHPYITLVAVLPLLAVVIFAYLLQDRILRYYDASRTATGAVTGFPGEILSGVQAINVANAEPICAGISRH
jgi:ABC-type multidrug transport system fused ATPase/permease subunit